MSQMKYTTDHEWIRLESDGTATVGITDHAQSELGDVVFVELPEVGRAVQQGEQAAVVESVKAAGEVGAPVAGTVVAVNENLAGDPAKVNADPYGEGWFYRLQPGNPADLDGLLDEAAYRALVGESREPPTRR